MEENQHEDQISYLPIAVRALTFTGGNEKRTKKQKEKIRWPDRILVFDTETTTDATQRLNFGSYWWGDPETLEAVEEGLFYADDLPTRDAEGFQELKRYVADQTTSPITGKAAKLQLRPRQDFVYEVFLKAAYKSRALVVGFNLSFDLSRLAVNYGLARGPFYRGGFCFTLSDFVDKHGKRREHLWRPRVAIKPIDSKRAFIGFMVPSKVDPANVGDHFPGYFLDLRTLGWALTNKPGGLAKMCETFGVVHGKDKAREHGKIMSEYIEYNVHDVRATLELYQKLRAEFDLHPIDLEPYRTYSPASMGKKYLHGANLITPRKKFRNISMGKLAKTMSAFFGGRAECKFRGIVPVVYSDFTSMYPTVNVLIGLWRLLIADHIKIVDCTDEVRQLLAAVTKDECFNPDSWKKLAFFARMRPGGDILPVRARYEDGGDALNIGINMLTSPTSLYYPGPDLVASTLLCGKSPIVEKAIRFVPVGIQSGLRPIQIRGAVAVDPEKQDFFRAPVEERQLIKQRLKDGGQISAESFLKVLANSSTYGIYAEMNRVELTKPRVITAQGINGPFRHRTKSPEELGEFCFPPVAALISSAARLKLALLERCVADAGGSFASCDTDSMTIISTQKGGPIRVKVGDKPPYQMKQIHSLSWAAVDAIKERFESLNPYDRKAVPGSILKIENENYADKDCTERQQLFGFFLASKRYALFNYSDEGDVSIRKASEHGFGHLRNPKNPDDTERKWVEEIWKMLILEELGRTPISPPWFAQPAVSQESISSPQLLKPFLRGKKRAPYAERVKPFNFVLSAHVMPFGHPHGMDPRKCHLITEYSREPERWLKGEWIDIHSKRTCKITTKDLVAPSIARVKSIADVYEEYKTHPESKSAGPDGNPCSPHTRGPLFRRHVYAAYIRLIGKEANKLEEVEHEMIDEWSDVREEYQDPKNDPWFTLVVPILKLPDMHRDDLAKRAGVEPRTIQALRNGHWKPSEKHRAALIRAAGDYARQQTGLDIRDNLCACAAFLHTRTCARGVLDSAR